MKRVYIDIDGGLHQALKQTALDQQTSLKAIIEGLINDWLEVQMKPKSKKKGSGKNGKSKRKDQKDTG